MPKRPPNFKVVKKKRGWATTRKSRRARGYGPQWDRLRDEVLADEPLCRSCKAEGIATIATTVDHIVPKHKGGGDERSNLQPLCNDCHKAKTAKEAVEARFAARRS